ncbi:MAG: sugar ABC transporter ATP-binding protein, partial [Anaerolineaceae bacterium]
MNHQPLLRMANISKHFPGVQALDNVDFEVYPGEIVGLLGENGAGKSTLIKILSGVYTKDQGSIYFRGESIDPKNPQDSQSLGISTIYQELALVPQLSVAENLFLNREPRLIPALGMIDFKKMEADARIILHDLGVDIPPNKLLKDLTVAAQQMVEITKAVSRNANLILMDEPTSALSNKEVKAIFEIMNRLKEKGVSVVFVSHRLEEVMKIVDRVIVMRDGQRVGELPIQEASMEKIIRLMVGREVGLFHKIEKEIKEPVLEVRGLSGNNLVKDVSLTVRKGEIVGLAGLVGAGRTDVARLIFGADRRTSGTILINNEPVQINNPSDAVEYGIGWVPEDRKQQGLVLGMNMKENASIAILQRISNLFGVINLKQQNEIVKNYIKKLNIATSSMEKQVNELSGGNQQKVVLAKWLATKPKVLIMDEPTRGIDVGAKAEVHALISQLAKEGMAILMISSEMPEIMGMSDRVIVMCQGRITGEFDTADFDQEEI